MGHVCVHPRFALYARHRSNRRDPLGPVGRTAGETDQEERQQKQKI
jgi:hypothetical protein